MKEKENQGCIEAGVALNLEIQEYKKKRDDLNAKSKQAMSDCLEMWRDFSTYEANFVNSSDISVASRLANLNLEIQKVSNGTLSKQKQGVWLTDTVKDDIIGLLSKMS